MQVWQAFVGVKARRVEKYYYDLLAEETNTGNSMDNDIAGGAFRKWRKQIEKVIRCMFQFVGAASFASYCNLGFSLN